MNYHLAGVAGVTKRHQDLKTEFVPSRRRDIR